MKNLMAALLFLVQWQENELKPHYFCDGMSLDECADLVAGNVFSAYPSIVYTVETVDHSITLKMQGDMDKFLGKKVLIDPCHPPFGIWPSKYPDDILKREGGLIGDKAFNVKVKEIPEGK